METTTFSQVSTQLFTLFSTLVSIFGRLQKMLRTFFKKILPWLFVVAIFVYLFKKYPIENVYNSLKYVNIYTFCLTAVLYFGFMYLLDTFSIAKILNQFGHEASVRELLPARGFTYLAMIINYAASQAAFAFYQYRKHGLSISEMLGIFGIIVVVDLYILATLAFVATFFTRWPFTMAGMNIGHFIRIFVAIAYVTFVLNMVFWKGYLGKISFLERLRTRDFFAVLARCGIRDYLSVMLYRLPVHIFIMGGMYIAVQAFGAFIPFVKIVANIPLIFFIGALPLTPGGIGTSNVALVELFKPYISAAPITAGLIGAGDLLFSFSLVWLFANYLMKALTGVICLKFVSKNLFEPIIKNPQ